MSEPAAAVKSDAHAADLAAQPKRDRGLFTKLLAAGFMATVVVTECLVGYLWFFSSTSSAEAAPTEEKAAADEGHGRRSAKSEHGEGKEETADKAAPAEEKSHGEKAEKKGHASAEGEGKETGHGSQGDSDTGAPGHGHGPVTGDYVEFDLGKFNVMAFQPASNSMRVIEFHLYGTVATDDREDFQTLWDENQQRCRDQVIVTIRSAEVEDFTDPALGLIKRKILARTNDMLGKPLLEEVIFSEFSFIEE